MEVTEVIHDCDRLVYDNDWRHSLTNIFFKKSLFVEIIEISMQILNFYGCFYLDASSHERVFKGDRERRYLSHKTAPLNLRDNR